MTILQETVEAVCRHLTKSGMEGLATTLCFSLQQGPHAIFLAAERCLEACVDMDTLPSAAPATLGRAVRASDEAGMILAVGVRQQGSRQVPTGFGLAFSLRARNASHLIPALTCNHVTLIADEHWGRTCGVTRHGGVLNHALRESHASTMLHPYPSSDLEEEVFGTLIERCNALSIPWARTMDDMTAPKTSAESACRMLFHAAGHLCGDEPVQMRSFAAAALRQTMAS